MKVKHRKLFLVKKFKYIRQHEILNGNKQQNVLFNIKSITHDKYPISSRPQFLNQVLMTVRHGTREIFLCHLLLVWNLVSILCYCHLEKSAKRKIYFSIWKEVMCVNILFSWKSLKRSSFWKLIHYKQLNE